MHKLRVINPSTVVGATQGTEVWLDDRQLLSVTRVEFLAELNSVYHVRIDLNVRLEELAVYASPELRATEQDRARLAAIRELWHQGDGEFEDQDREWVRRMQDLIDQDSTL